MTDAEFDWPLLLRRLDQREHAWNTRRVSYPRADAVPFMPYPLPLFAALLIDAVQALPSWAAYDDKGNPQRASFLDVGCGPGTKMLLAQELFDLDVSGIDIVPEFIAEARDCFLDAEVADAFDYGCYDQFAIVLVNRPSGLQDDLEQLVCEKMRPGAVLMAINWRNDPAAWGWHCAAQEAGQPIRGVWCKPVGAVHLLGPSLDPMARTACCGKTLAALPPDDSLTPDRPRVTCPQKPPLPTPALDGP